jgi:hypothetical protein
MKKGIILAIFLLLGIGSASAYGLFDDLFDPYNLEMIMPAILFLFFFALTSYPLGKTLKDSHGNPNRATITIVSGCVSFFILYWIQRSGWDYQYIFSNSISDFFSGAGISVTVVYPILGIAILAFTAYLMVRLGIGAALFIIGAIAVVMSFTDLVYQSTLLRFVGFVLVTIGAFLLYRRSQRTYYMGRAWA